MNPLSGSSEKKEGLKSIIQFIKFGIVGVSNTVISLGIYYVLVLFNINYIIANTVGFIVSVLNSYYWNNKYVFKSEKRNHLRALRKTFIAYGSTFLIGTLFLYIMVQYMNVSQVMAPIINLLFTIPINFMINKLWAFR